jgi:putative transposase
MPNHIHLLLTPHGANACALLMKNLGQQYVQKVNYRLGRTGTLWEGRFFSSLATSERYILNCYRYIDRNPVRAGIVPAPGDYGWSSYAANAEGKRDGLLRPHVAYDGLAVELQERLRTYRELCDQDPPQAVLDEIRKATRVGGVIGKRRRQRGRPPKAK